MAVNWTKEQTQVIESRGNNLLVSAAAGSGKTAVLVERIIRLVTEGEHPMNIDELLVMTFTNAAAAEMRERIGTAIEEKLRENPGDTHLQMQSTLVHHAQITTIDSFCLRIIREHFNDLDIDPSFRVGDEGELLLLRADAMKEMLEDSYENGGSRFEQFVETYAQGKSDAGIEDYIMQVYTFAQSNPWPQQWIADCRAEIGADGRTGREPRESVGQTEEKSGHHASDRPAWERFLVRDLGRQTGELAEQMREAYEICREDEYLCAYAPMLQQDTIHLTALSQAGCFQEMYDILTTFTWDRLATVRSKSVDPERKAYVTGCRDRAKKAITKMKDRYCFADLEEMEADRKAAAKETEVLLDLAEDFARRFQEKKRERNLVDFNDLEHEALRVLIRREDGKIGYTDVADELSRGFGEVLVDEYQDSNLVQETLLQAVSGERFGRHNLFMVGDVKQSIYKFRLARPEIFLDKYENYEPYEKGDSADRKIELHQNFRSRAEVLDGVNDVFFRIMTENLGNIRYSKEAALYPGAAFEKLPDGRTAAVPELLMVDTGGGSLAQPDDDAADYTAKEIEAKLIVRRIREMTDPKRGLLVWDKKENRYRIAQYRDMVILLRSTVGWTETLLSVLMNEGIPAYAESREGYFNTIEVETILSLLSVIDNPMQDIPLTAVLKSPIVGMSDQELAGMMVRFRRSADRGADRGMYGAMRSFLEQETSDGALTDTETSGYGAIARKLNAFWKLLLDFRAKSRYLPIHELLYEIYEKTGYDRLVSVMPAGATRRANLDMLVEKAAAYEKTSYKGLFHFVRYIENLKRYHTDFGAASTVGEEENTVRIMSIHKSKGLEFPIVFLAGMGKKFNRRDGYGKVLIDPELGIATDYLDTKRRLKAVTLKKNVLRRKMELDNLGEELRVLYVAMTRAKEMLVMTGTDRYLAKNLERFSRVPVTDGRIPYTVLGTAGCYLDWLLMASGSGTIRIRMEEIPLSQIVGGELVRQVQTRQSRAFLETMDLSRVYDEDVRKMLETNLNDRYPYAADIRLPMQASVSELKQWRDDGEEEQGLVLFAECEDEMAGQPEGDHAFLGGATRGTAYHRVLELLPFDCVESRREVEEYLKQMVREKKLSEKDRTLVNSGVLWRFLDSDLGRRMRRAQAAGRLYKERQFVMGVPAREMGMGDSDEMVVVQGIIDSWFEEDGELVLVDYKTDRVEQASVLREHYKKQLDYYERALGQMTGKRVKEKMIYSLALQMEIDLE